jgi:AmiR/NasT family two-component response regulator
VVIEQAKGMIAERGGHEMADAFERLRAFARNSNRGLTEVAEALVDGTLSVDSMLQERRTTERRTKPR